MYVGYFIMKQNGISKGIVYALWSTLKARCYNKNHISYPWYGLKGIKVCEEWLKYINFEKWMLLNGYNSKMSIDRIDSTKDYYPENCRIIPKSHQPRNRSKITNTKNNITGVYYIKKCKTKPYRAQIKIDGKSKVIGYYITELEASIARDTYIIQYKLENFKLNNTII